MTAVPFHQDAQVVRGFLHFARVVGALTCAAALIVLAGCWWDLPRWTALMSGNPPMAANAAIGFALSGASLVLSRAAGWWRKGLGSVLSLIAMGIGVVTLAAYMFAVDLGIDPGLERLVSHARGPSGRRMTELGAVALALLGSVGVLTSVRRCLWLREALAIALLAIAMTVLASHGFALAGADNSVFSHVPIQTTLLLLLATLGWLSATPTIGLTRVATAATFGGAFARRLLLPALMLPVVFTYVFELLQSWLGMPEVLTFALMAVFSGGTVAWLIWWGALLLDQLERQRLESARLRNDADTDALTGLANRRAFDDALGNLLKGHREHDTDLSLLMLDLDRFKSYNDDFGHLAGDEVLRITGHLLGIAVRPADVAARYGGEEFALLLPDTHLIEAGEVAARVLEAFRTFGWPHRAVTISIGVAQSISGDDAAALIERADAALYEAKNTGRNRAVSAISSPVASVAR